MMTRLTSTVVILAACGGNSGTPIDSASFLPDGTCPGLVELQDGGQVFFEYITYDSQLQATFGLPSGVTTQSRLTAFFLSDQIPEVNPLPTAGACNNLFATKGWPTFIGTPRTELDVGRLTVSGMNSASAPTTLVPTELMNSIDDWGRAQDVY